MDNKIKIAILIVVLLLIGAAWYDLNSSNAPTPEELDIRIQKDNYSIGDALRMNIKNYRSEKVCFSSCYPYFLEKKENGRWVRYEYGECPKENVNETCMLPEELKGFKIKLNTVEPGKHRIVIPVCKGRNQGERFKETEKVTSEEFVISR